MKFLESTKKMMRAVAFERYGNPEEVMKVINDQEIPKPNANQVLVKITYSSINAADQHMIRANYLIIRLLLGLFKPAKKNRIVGMDITGSIEAVGDNVKDFNIGDEIVADMRKSLGGGFAEYAIVDVENLVKIPSNVSHEQAATVPISGQAAMMGILLCEIQPGDRVLINGASGGVGSFGVQLAKYKGAHVTAICSSEKASAVKSWGADEVIDYKKTSVSELENDSYDKVFDVASFRSPKDFKKTLKKDGRYILVGGNYYNMLKVKFFGKCYARGTQKFKSLTQDVEVNENIKTVLDLIGKGKVIPAIQKTISLEDVPSAIGSLEKRTIVGKVIVNLNA
ncbi:NAD(P)-dependent alcohol dehydrogenase [Flammeovirga kamogawensis]|uniref:NAD(P)-dependent alcohol dehydrogenase n=1 Tax=Flammeovirga kamogawensis TaxID=373891 RepID=A0ABX8GYV5_9BACT|nr:NAD(P)-dependent alcohol dehydrogenase [Flammeovirga kamogawensis]MBB6458989.1 NADPH:quinone reductase-like Zn-dependent oxidoreductase [Flammeovirga kamogawensis]QWG08564.1 NAD(P)-dependent alcohol dehydrogenase [Flammeovirga kamogawensis]TRX66855.1 NAD(P)-dependent alcohol dehydrogenase [Flammeovirga kamogawensis]